MNTVISRLALAASAGLCVAAHAQTTWSGNIDTNWLNPGNWSPAIAPGFGAGTNATAVIDPAWPTIVRVTSAPDVLYLTGFRATSPGVETRVADTNIRINSVFDQHGVFILDSGAFRSRLWFDGTQLTGGGELIIAATLGHPDRAMVTFSNNPAVSAGTRIHGRGYIVGAFDNSGSVTADQFGEQLSIDPNAGSAFPFRNQGVLAATQGATLVLGLFEYQNAGGTILADGGTVRFRDSGDIFGGTLATAHAGQIHLTGSIYESGVTFAGDVFVSGADYLRFNANNLNPTVHNSGAIHAGNPTGGAYPAFMNIRYSTTLTGGGAISLEGRTGLWQEAQFTASDVYAVLTNAPGHTIRGIGTLITDVINQGTISVGFPGTAPNTDQLTVLEFDRPLTLTPGGTVEVPIAPGSASGILLATRPLTLGGALRVWLEDGPLAANPGSAWDLILAPTLGGGFSGLSLPPLPANRRWIAAILHGEGVETFRITITCAADYNGDGFVDFFDFDAFVDCFENAVCPQGASADFNNDGFVDFFDFDGFVEAFEAGC